MWYTICGVPLENRAEYILLTMAFILVATVVFGNLHFGSGGDQVFNEKTDSIPKKQINKKWKLK